MGRLIDGDKAIKDMQYYYDDCATTSVYTKLGFETAMEVVKSAPTEEAIPKDQYEARFKADMVDMLTEIQLEIDELRLDRPLMSRGHECYGHKDKTPTEIQQECSEIIQQKINSLKAESEG